MHLKAQQVMIGLLAVVLVAAAGRAAQPAEEAAANAAIAERMAQFAQSTLMGRQIVPATLRESAAALEEANRLNPTEPRFLRLLTEAYLQLGGEEGAQGAQSSLTRYRALVPADQGAQIQLIDVYYSQMETSEKRKKYLDDLLAAASIPPEVKSHIAVMAARLSEERSESTAAEKYIDQALSLMPLNSEALRSKYQQINQKGTSVDRVTLLFQMLRANPAQPAVMLELGSELANAGMVDPSLNWYRNGFELLSRLGMYPDPVRATAYSAELVIADQLVLAQTGTKKLLENDPSNVEAAIMALLIERRGGNAEKIEMATTAARNAMMARLARISQAAQGGTGPATQPATTSPSDLDIAADVKKLLELSNPQASAQYAASLADLAWLEIYFNNKPADAEQYLTPLRQLLAPDSVILTRLEGWSFLINGKADEARVKLSAVADRDPLAALGMLRLDKDQPAAQLDATAKKLLIDHPSGVIGAILMEALRSRFGMMPLGPNFTALRAQADAFPNDWLDFLDFSRVQTFYSLKAEPLKVGYSFGEPMLARVTIINTGKYDITIGPEGAIHPDLWFDVQIKGPVSQGLTGIALDRMTEKLLLHPKDSATTTVRLDQGALAAVTQGSPNLLMSLFFSVLTNPLTQQTGIAPGPGGYRAQLTHTVVRNSSPMTPEAFKKIYTDLQSAPADTRIRLIELLGSYSVMLRQQQDPALQAKATELAQTVRKSTADASPAVRASAMYVSSIVSDAQIRQGLIHQMLTDSDPVQRILGIAALQQGNDAATLQEAVKPLAESDADPIVKKVAVAAIEVSKLAPTTAPATAPTTEESLPGLGGPVGPDMKLTPAK